MTPELTICLKCYAEKNVDSFYKDKSRKNGRRPYCISCVKEQNKKYRIKNRKKYLESQRKYSLVNREKYRLRASIWYLNNKERALQNAYRWGKKNQSKVLEYKRNWEKNNSEYKKYASSLRMHRKRANGGMVTLQEWEELKIIYGNKCIACKAREHKLEMDHIIPISKGGAHIIDNIQPMCRSCNAKKYTKVVNYRENYGKP